MKYSDLKWHEKLIFNLFGGCPGCRFIDREHCIHSSYTHKNPLPTSPSPFTSKQNRNSSDEE